MNKRRSVREKTQKYALLGYNSVLIGAWMMLANVFENKMTLYFGLKNSKLVLDGNCFEFYPGEGGGWKGHC